MCVDKIKYFKSTLRHGVDLKYFCISTYTMWRIIFTAGLLLASAGLRAQLADPLHVKIFDTHDGLLSTEIHALHQDQKGYLWIGTAIGLSRFDGYTFKNYTTADGLTKGKVAGITESREGHLWIATEKGICRFDGENFQAVRFRNESLTEFLFEMHLTEKEELWIGSSKGAGKLARKYWDKALTNPDSSYFEHVAKDLFVSVIQSDTTGNIYLGGNNFLFQYQKNGLDTLGQGDAGIHDFFYSILPLENNRLLTGTLNGNFYLFEKKQRSLFIPPDPGRADIFNIIPFQKEYWALHQDGILVIHPDGTVNSYSIYDHYGIKLMYCLLKDRENNFWLGSNEGLIRITPRDFRLYPELNAAMPNGIFSIGENEKGQLFLGSNHGIIYSKNMDQTHFSRYPLPPNVPGAEIVGIFFDQQDHLWFTTYWDGICQLKDEKIIRYWYEDGLYPGADINFGLIDADDHIWLGHNYGLSKMIRKDAGKYQFRNYEEVSEIAFNTGVIDSFQHLWLGSQDGLFGIVEGDSLIRYPLPFADVSVTGLAVDQQQQLWITTLGKGVYRYKILGAGELQLVDNYDLEDGLFSNFLLDAEADDEGNIWLGSYLGISVIRKTGDDYRLTNYDPEDGLIEKAYQKIILHKDRQGFIWAATSMGLMSFNPQDIHFNETVPALNLSSVRINGEALDLSREDNDLLKLPYFKNDIEISILGISLKNPGKNRYRFMLKGATEKWSAPAPQRTFAFNNLAPGRYDFLFKASNNDQVWNKEPAVFSFFIRPPFWATWWFYTLLAVVSGTAVFYYVKRRERRIQEKEREQGRINKMIAELETRALRAQMNPHFIFNSLNAIQESILTKQFDVAYKYLNKFSRLLRNVLESSAQSYIRIEKEIEILNLYLELESLRFDEQFEYQIKVDDSEEDITELFIPSLMVQPFVENAIWHGLMQKEGRRKVSIHFSFDEHSITCRIKDNGIGRTAAQKISRKKRRNHQSMALQLIRDRLELIQQQNEKSTSIQINDLYDSENCARGTEVNIRVPNDLIPENPS